VAAGDVRHAIEDCDAVVDLVHPWQTDTKAMRNAIERRAAQIFEAARPSALVIYASTISVFNLDPGRPRYTIYSSTKRFAERVHLHRGAHSDRPVFVLRLGQVHGLLQQCSLEMLEVLRRNPRLAVPEVRSYTVFVTSIAEAIEQILQGIVRPGTYTLLSNPEWSYEELVRYWAGEAGVSPEVRTVQRTTPSLLGRLGAYARSVSSTTALRHRELLWDWASGFSPNLVHKVRFWRHRNMASGQIAAFESAQYLAPFIQQREVPGARLTSLSDSRATMPPKHAAAKELLSALSPSGRTSRPNS